MFTNSTGILASGRRQVSATGPALAAGFPVLKASRTRNASAIGDCSCRSDESGLESTARSQTETEVTTASGAPRPSAAALSGRGRQAWPGERLDLVVDWEHRGRARGNRELCRSSRQVGRRDQVVRRP